MANRKQNCEVDRQMAICLPPPVSRLDEEPSAAGGRQAVVSVLPPPVWSLAEEPMATGGRYCAPGQAG